MVEIVLDGLQCVSLVHQVVYDEDALPLTASVRVERILGVLLMPIPSYDFTLMKSILTPRWSETTIATGIPPLAIPMTRSNCVPPERTFSASASARLPYSGQLRYLNSTTFRSERSFVDNS